MDFTGKQLAGFGLLFGIYSLCQYLCLKHVVEHCRLLSLSNQTLRLRLHDNRSPKKLQMDKSTETDGEEEGEEQEQEVPLESTLESSSVASEQEQLPTGPEQRPINTDMLVCLRYSDDVLFVDFEHIERPHMEDVSIETCVGPLTKPKTKTNRANWWKWF